MVKLDYIIKKAMGGPGDKKLWVEVGMTLLWGLVSALVAHAFAATQSGGLCATLCWLW